MAFNVNELNVIRSYIAVTGNAPSASEFEAAFANFAGLSNLLATLVPSREEATNRQFIESLYTNAGLELNDGVDYWLGELSGFTRAEVAMHFQWAAQEDAAFDAKVEAGIQDRGLEGNDSVFSAPSEGDGGEVTPEPTEFRTEIEFVTDQDPYDHISSPVRDLADQNPIDFESPMHRVFNLGKDAIDAGQPNITDHFTFSVANQLGTFGRYEGYFLSPVLAPTVGEAGGSELNFRIYDQFAPANDADVTLDNAQINVLRFDFNGQTYRIESDELKAARTYQELEAAVKKYLADTPALSGLTAQLTSTFSTPQFGADNELTGERVEGIALQIRAQQGELENGAVSGESATGSQGGVNYTTSSHSEDGTSGNIETNLELSNVGYGSQGGSVNIAGQSSSNKGIEIFNVKAEKGVWLTQLTSTPWGDRGFNSNEIMQNSLLRTINLEGSGYFKVGQQDGEDVMQSATAGLHNVSTFNASAFDGSVQLDASLNSMQVTNVNYNLGGSDNTLLMDVQDNSALNLNITSGSGTDVVNVDLGNNNLNFLNSGLDINTGAGNDEVKVTGDVSSQGTARNLDNVEIDTGAGDDTILINGTLRADIDAGAGNDFVVINQNEGAKGNWSVGTVSGVQAGPGVGSVLYEANLTVTFAGFESTVKVPTNAQGKFVADQLAINKAIVDAIAQHQDLKRLLDTNTGPNDQVLYINSIVGGENALTIEINQPDVVTGTPTDDEVPVPTGGDLNALIQGLMTDTTSGIKSGSDANAVAGAINAVATNVIVTNTGGSSNATGVNNVNFSVIDMGTGTEDLVVFDSNVNSANVLKVSGQFDHVSVVNFHDQAPQTVDNADQVGNHALDFTELLNNQTDGSNNNNAWSAQDINITLNSPVLLMTGSTATSTTTALANSVNLLGYKEKVTDSISFANLTAAQLVAALNGDAAAGVVTGGLDQASLNAAQTTTNLVGNVQKHIVMIENLENPGEYKVFFLTSTVPTTGSNEGKFDTGTAQLLGTMDFGASINFGLVGNATWEAKVADLIKDADEFVAGPIFDTIFTATPVTAVKAVEAVAEVQSIPVAAEAIVEGREFTLTFGEDSITTAALETTPNLETLVTAITAATGYADLPFEVTAGDNALTLTWKETEAGAVETLATLIAPDVADPVLAAFEAIASKTTEGLDAVEERDASTTFDLAQGVGEHYEAGYTFTLTVGSGDGQIVGSFTLGAQMTAAQAADALRAAEAEAWTFVDESVMSFGDTLIIGGEDTEIILTDSGVTDGLIEATLVGTAPVEELFG